MKRGLSRYGNVLSIVAILIFLCWAFWQSVMYTAGKQAEELVVVTVSGQQRWMHQMAAMTLKHLANLPEVKRLEADSCTGLQSDLVNGNKLFAVMALGDKNGEPICTADPKIATPLPTMADRSYFQKVKSAKDLVVGNYEISKTTGKAVIHYAYPILGEKGEFRGFIMMAMDLSWFPNELVDHVFRGQNTQIMAVDRNGKILFTNPSSPSELGKNAVSPSIMRQLLKDDISSKYLQGSDGQYRVYAHAPIGDMAEGVMIFAGVSLFDYAIIMWIHVAFMGLMLVGGWAWVKLRDKAIKRKRG